MKFAAELEKLPLTYDSAMRSDVTELSKFVGRARNLPLYIVGSGGSYTPAYFAGLLHMESGMIAKCMTPLEFCSHKSLQRDCSVLLVSAGGGNTDILSAYNHARRQNPQNIGILSCTSKNRLVDGAKNCIIHATDTPAGRDGFLATNSTLSCMVWLARAYAGVSASYLIPPSHSEITMPYDSDDGSSLPSGLGADTTRKMARFSRRPVTLLILHDMWGAPAAVDLESKLAEAGLVNVQLADYRSFGHGRHNWLDKNAGSTGVVALYAPETEDLARRTIRLIPDGIPVAAFNAVFGGPAAAMALYLRVLYVVKYYGIIRKIDPGAPGIPDFGRELHRLPMRAHKSGVPGEGTYP